MKKPSVHEEIRGYLHCIYNALCEIEEKDKAVFEEATCRLDDFEAVLMDYCNRKS